MSDKTLNSKSDSQTKLLQHFLLGSTIPFTEGGGVVFPHGFPGVGYRLEEWQFDRYRARLDRNMLGDAARQRQRTLFFMLIVFAVAVFALALGVPFISNHPTVAPHLPRWAVDLDPWPLVTLLIIAALVFRRVQRSLLMQQPEQSEPFEGAPKVSRFAYLPRRVLGMISSGQVSMNAQHIRLLLSGSLTLVFLALGLSDPEFRDENLFPAALAAIYAIRPLYFCFIYWHFRLRNGRSPGPQDLKPLSLSAS